MTGKQGVFYCNLHHKQGGRISCLYEYDDTYIWPCCEYGPHGLTLTWWGYCGLSFKQTELVHSFLFCSCVCFCLYGPFNCISFHEFSPTTLCFLNLFFWSNFCFISSFNYISLYESLLQPLYNPLLLTGLKAPTNSL